MMRRIKNLVLPQKGGHKIDPIQFKFFRLLLTILLAAIISIGCSSDDDDDGDSGNNGGGNTTYATITGTVSGTIAVAIDEDNNEVDRDTAEGTPKTFTLTVPVGGKYRFYFVENEGTADEKMFVLYWGTTNVFTITSEVTIDLGFIDTSSGVAIPENDPLSQGSTDGGIKYSNATMSGVWIWGEAACMVANGDGVILYLGLFYVPKPAGIYDVSTDGSFTMTVGGGGEVEGYFNSPTQAVITVKAPDMDQPTTATMQKVVDISAAEGGWNGTVTYSDAQYDINFSVNANGIAQGIIFLDNLPFNITGRMYILETGIASCFFESEADNEFNQFLLSGNIAGSSFTGTIRLDCGGCEGEITLTR